MTATNGRLSPRVELRDHAAKQASIAATARIGDRVRVMPGILQGMETEFREIRSSKARLQVRVFSAEIAAEIDVSGPHKLD